MTTTTIVAGRTLPGYTHEDLETKLMLIKDMLMHVSTVHQYDPKLKGTDIEELDRCWSKVYDIIYRVNPDRGTTKQCTQALWYRGQ